MVSDRKPWQWTFFYKRIFAKISGSLTFLRRGKSIHILEYILALLFSITNWWKDFDLLLNLDFFLAWVGWMVGGYKLALSLIWSFVIVSSFYRLHGSYEAIEGGQTMDALVDLTGGLAERHIIQNKDPQLYRIIERARSSGAFITCSRKVGHCWSCLWSFDLNIQYH